MVSKVLSAGLDVKCGVIVKVQRTLEVYGGCFGCVMLEKLIEDCPARFTRIARRCSCIC